MHAPDTNRRIQIDNYRQFKFGMHPPTRKPLAHCAQSYPSLSNNATNPRRDGGASGGAQAPTYTAALPTEAHSFNLRVAPSGAAVSRPFTRPGLHLLRHYPPTHLHRPLGYAARSTPPSRPKFPRYENIKK